MKVLTNRSERPCILYPVGYTLGVLEVLQTTSFRSWLDKLRDRRAQARIAARILALESGHFGDWKAIDGTVSELRVQYGPGYRVYFMRRGQTVVILLAGGDKATQKRDIERARRLAETI